MENTVNPFNPGLITLMLWKNLEEPALAGLPNKAGQTITLNPNSVDLALGLISTGYWIYVDPELGDFIEGQPEEVGPYQISPLAKILHNKLFVTHIPPEKLNLYWPKNQTFYIVVYNLFSEDTQEFIDYAMGAFLTLEEAQELVKKQAIKNTHKEVEIKVLEAKATGSLGSTYYYL